MTAALISLLGKVLDPILGLFLGKRFSLAELLLSSRSARRDGREEARNEARDHAVDQLDETRREADRIRRDSDARERLRDRYR